MNVPLLDLKPQTKFFREKILTALTEVIDSTQYILGPVVQEFEQSVANYCGVDHGIGVSSGTDALLISLMALDIGPGDLVLTTPYTFFATMGSIMRVGARPVFVDIKPDSMNIDPQLVAMALEKDRQGDSKIKAIIPVHLFGQCADMSEMMTIANKYNIYVIEDAAQAIGSACPVAEKGETIWKKAGSMGDVGCFSFFPSKNLGGIGDGGMVTTNDEKLAERLRSFRNHGAKPKYYHSFIGGNFRLDPVQAAVLAVKLPYLNDWHKKRQENRNTYDKLFLEAGLTEAAIDLPSAVFASKPEAATKNHHIYNQYVIKTEKRDELRAFLLDNNVGCEVYYPLCLHQQECLRPYGYNKQSLPVAEKAAKQSLALPIYPELVYEQQQYVVAMISKFIQAG